MLDWSQARKRRRLRKSAATTETDGLIIGTHIATAIGWRPVEALCVGDLVLTFDHGLRPVMGIRRVVVWDGEGRCPSALRPLEVEKGILCEHNAVRVLPDQGVMVESDAAENYRGDPFAVIKPRMFEAFNLAHRMRPTEPIEVVVIEFEEDEVVYGSCGLLFHMPKAYDFFADDNPADSYKLLNKEESKVVILELYENSLDFTEAV